MKYALRGLVTPIITPLTKSYVHTMKYGDTRKLR